MNSPDGPVRPGSRPLWPGVTAHGSDGRWLGRAILAPDSKMAAQGGSIVLGRPDVTITFHDPAAFAQVLIGGQVVRQRVARLMLRSLRYRQRRSVMPRSLQRKAVARPLLASWLSTCKPYQPRPSGAEQINAIRKS